MLIFFSTHSRPLLALKHQSRVTVVPSWWGYGRAWRIPTADLPIKKLGFKAPLAHRWASTSILKIGNIRHRHLLFRYRRQICRTENQHSDIGSVPISTWEFIPKSDILKKNLIPPGRFQPVPLEPDSEHYNTKLRCLSIFIGMSDSG